MANVLGWREWVALPELGLGLLKAKIDTGARTSALQSQDVRTFERGGKTWVRFEIPDTEGARTAEAPLVEFRWVKDSGGHSTYRPVVETLWRVGPEELRIELTLAQRPDMGFRLLIGRQALRERFLVDPGASYLMTTLVSV